MIKLALYGSIIFASFVSFFLPAEYIVSTKTSSKGSFYFYSTKFCFIRDCALNSVDSTYGVITFPSRMHSNEYDRVTFDLKDNEYLDINMITPYPCFYFGWSIYLMDRWFDYKHQQYGASINDTINSFNIRSQLRTENPFQKEIRLFVSHSDHILSELREFHRNDKSVFFLSWNAFPHTIVPYNSTGDRLSLYLRILMPQDTSLLQQYITNNPVTVYRYKLNSNVINSYSPKPLGTWIQRSDNGVQENRVIKTEFDIFCNEIAEIVHHKSRKNNRVLLHSLPHRNSINYDNGWDCMLYKKQCWADNRDTVYIGTGYIKDNDVVGFPLKYETLILLVGVNHTHFSNSLYNSLQLYDYTNEQGFFSFHGFDNVYEQSRSYKNSCKTIYESLTGKYYAYRTEQFYCILVSREDFNYWELPIETQTFYKQISINELPYSNLFNTVERSYLQSEFSISSVYNNLVYPLGTMFY